MRSHLLAIALCAVAAALPTASRAQAPSLAGDYLYVAEGSDDVNRAIETAVARMNFVTRPIARGRLRRTNIPYRTLQIAHTPTTISVHADQAAPVVAPASGQQIRWRREDGETFDVSTEWDGPALVQTFRAEDGQRVNRYTLAPGGDTLIMTVSVTSPRLARPLTSALRYARR